MTPERSEMKAIVIPTTQEELKAVCRELDAAHYFANASEDPSEIKLANDRIDECERAIDACPRAIVNILTESEIQ